MSRGKEYRPKMEIPKSDADKIIDILNAVLVALLIALPAWYFGQLPDEIPIHFNGSGEVDNTGSKNFLWFIPAIGLGLYVLFTFLMRMPHTFNYPTKITTENALDQYRDGVRMMRWLLLLILLLFVYIAWGTIRIGLGHATAMNKFVFWTLTAAVVLMPFYFLYKSTKAN